MESGVGQLQRHLYEGVWMELVWTQKVPPILAEAEGKHTCVAGLWEYEGRNEWWGGVGWDGMGWDELVSVKLNWIGCFFSLLVRNHHQ